MELDAGSAERRWIVTEFGGGQTIMTYRGHAALCPRRSAGRAMVAAPASDEPPASWARGSTYDTEEGSQGGEA